MITLSIHTIKCFYDQCIIIPKFLITNCDLLTFVILIKSTVLLTSQTVVCSREKCLHCEDSCGAETNREDPDDFQRRIKTFIWPEHTACNTDLNPNKYTQGQKKINRTRVELDFVTILNKSRKLDIEETSDLNSIGA